MRHPSPATAGLLLPPHSAPTHLSRRLKRSKNLSIVLHQPHRPRHAAAGARRGVGLGCASGSDCCARVTADWPGGVGRGEVRSSSAPRSSALRPDGSATASSGRGASRKSGGSWQERELGVARWARRISLGGEGSGGWVQVGVTGWKGGGSKPACLPACCSYIQPGPSCVGTSSAYSPALAGWARRQRALSIQQHHDITISTVLYMVTWRAGGTHPGAH